MNSQPAEAPRDPSTVLSDLRKSSDQITRLKQRRDNGKFQSVNCALALQRAIRQYERLRGELPRLQAI